MHRAAALVPAADAHEERHREERRQREPRDARLPVAKHDERRNQRLHHVVEEMTEAEGREDLEGRVHAPSIPTTNHQPPTGRMPKMVIRSVAVLGAGTMGAQIAAHFANAGVPALLLDVTADAARDGLKRARTLKPDPFFTPDAAALITTGAFDTDLPRLAHVDWIVEAVVEQIDIKRTLLDSVETVRRADTVISSNTSGIPIGTLAEGRSAEFRRH